VVGVVSKSDLLSAIARVLPQTAPVSVRAAA